MTVRLLHGDCRRALRLMAARGIMVDSIITDPPYHLTSIVKRFSRATEDDVYRNAEARKIFNQGSSPHARAARGFMGKQWDGGDIAFDTETWRLAGAVLKPGGHLLAFGGTRGWHRLACAIEDAGFEIRDTVAWLYGSGFPKSKDIGKAIDKDRGYWRGRAGAVTIAEQVAKGTEYERTQKGAPVTPEAAAWDGWGTALKPAFEPVILARKPLSEKSVAANVLRHGTGAINVAACKVGTEGGTKTVAGSRKNTTVHAFGDGLGSQGGKIDQTGEGRWPANVVHDGSAEVEAAFAAFGESKSPTQVKQGRRSGGNVPFGSDCERIVPVAGDSGSAARFFYSAKAGADDRFGSKHPTVKPVDLMRWLVRLITPPGGLVLDPFAGSGTTGVAALAEGMRAVLVEREAEYVADIRARLDHYRGKGKHSAAVKHRNRDVDLGPLFTEQGRPAPPSSAPADAARPGPSRRTASSGEGAES